MYYDCAICGARVNGQPKRAKHPLCTDCTLDLTPGQLLNSKFGVCAFQSLDNGKLIVALDTDILATFNAAEFFADFYLI